METKKIQKKYLFVCLSKTESKFGSRNAALFTLKNVRKKEREEKNSS